MTSAGVLTIWMGTVLVTQAGPAVKVDAGANGTAVKKSSKERAFELLDKDHNGVLVREEFVAGSLGKAAQAKLDDFKKLDGDKSGALNLDEFQKYEPPVAKRRNLGKEFQRRDKDADGKLTLPEMLQGRIGDDRVWARRNFVRFDANGDELLTLEEFQHREQGVALKPEQQFRLRDEDSDGRLTEQEFLRPLIGQKWYETAKQAFHRCDLDGNGVLSLEEFRLTPGQKPAAGTLFQGLNVDHDGKLTLTELTRTMDAQQRNIAWRSFGQYDVDLDGFLDSKEYEAWSTGMETAARRRQWQQTFVTWSPRILVPMAGLLTLWGLYAVSRWRRRRHKLARPAQATDKDKTVDRQPSIGDFDIQ